MLGVISGFFTGAKVWLSFIKINPESKIWNKHCLEIWYFFLLNKHNGVCTAYSFLTWKPPGLVCYIYDITGNDVHFVLDIKTVHLHRPFPCVSPQNFIAFCIDFLGCSSIGTNQNNWVSMKAQVWVTCAALHLWVACQPETMHQV